MAGNSLDELQRINLRQRRAYGLAHELMNRIMKASPYLHYQADGREQCAIHDAITGFLAEVGAEIVTDHDRSEAGLPPRGPDGWTVEELIALERRRIEVLLAPITVMPRVKCKMCGDAWPDHAKDCPTIVGDGVALFGASHPASAGGAGINPYSVKTTVDVKPGSTIAFDIGGDGSDKVSDR